MCGDGFFGKSYLKYCLSELYYTHKIINGPSQELKAMKSVPVFTSILDGIEVNIINKMDNEIEEIIDNYGGSADDDFSYSLR